MLGGGCCSRCVGTERAEQPCSSSPSVTQHTRWPRRQPIWRLTWIRTPGGIALPIACSRWWPNGGRLTDAHHKRGSDLPRAPSCAATRLLPCGGTVRKPMPEASRRWRPDSRSPWPRQRLETRRRRTRSGGSWPWWTPLDTTVRWPVRERASPSHDWPVRWRRAPTAS